MSEHRSLRPLHEKPLNADSGPAPAIRIAVQGEPGCFSHAAAVGSFGEVELVSCPDFPTLFDAVREGRAQVGVVPVENALAGAVSENLDLLVDRNLVAEAEIYVRVELCLAARPGPDEADRAMRGLTAAASHAVALRQCRRFFASHPHIRSVVTADTAGSIKDLMAGAGAWDAAIGPALAAELYGARILARGIEDDPRNFTRFLVVRPAGGEERGPPGPAPGHPVTGFLKASLVFTLPHRPGALHRALGIFADRGLDLTRLESRPIVGRPWEYRFHADIRGEDGAALRAAISALRRHAPELRVVGTYPEAEIP